MGSGYSLILLPFANSGDLWFQARGHYGEGIFTRAHLRTPIWERVTTASWRKFADPENKRTLSHILEVDTLNRKVDRSGRLYTTRAITIHAPGPWFIRKIVGQETSAIVLKLQLLVPIHDQCNCPLVILVSRRSLRFRYDPHPENPNEWTICKQETSIRIKPLAALASMAEKIEQKCVDKFQRNSAKGREVMERICKYLEAESGGVSI